jgi:hypothetical protein
MTEIAYHGASATTDSSPFASMKDGMEGMVISLSEHKPRTYKHADDADSRKERRRGRHAEGDGMQSLTMRKSYSGSGLSKIASRRQHSLWPVDSRTLRRSHTFDGDLVGGHDFKTTLTLKADSSDGSAKHGSEAGSSVRNTVSNPNRMEATEKKSKSKGSKRSKSTSSKTSKSKDKVAESSCKDVIPGKSLAGSNSSLSLYALSSAGLKVATTKRVSSSLLDHGNLILRQSKSDQLANNDASDGDQCTVQPRTESRINETTVTQCLFPVLMVENRTGSQKAGEASFPSLLLENALNN